MEVERLKFYKWLERRISKQKMTDLLMDVEQIETYVKKRGLADEPIFSIIDPEQVEKIRTSVSRANNNFSYGKRRIFVELLSYYHEYRTIHEELMDVESGDNHESKNRHLDTISLDSENNQKTDENSQKPEHSYTQPVAVVYSGNEVKVSSWRQVYTTVCKILIEDYPQKILQLRDSQETGVSNLIYDADEATQLRNPVQFSDGFFVETLADASELMKNTRILLDYCKVDYKDVVIRYKRNSEQEANPKKKNEAEDNLLCKSDPVLSFLNRNGIEYIDHRQKRGRLWIIGGEDIRPKVEVLREYGMKIRYRPEGGVFTSGRSTWWTYDYLEQDIIEENKSENSENVLNVPREEKWNDNKEINTNQIAGSTMFTVDNIQDTIEHIDSIDFVGKRFVFQGLYSEGIKAGDATLKRVEDKGARVLWSVSKATDYVVLNFNGDYKHKLKKLIDNKAEGYKFIFISLDNLISILDEIDGLIADVNQINEEVSTSKDIGYNEISKLKSKYSDGKADNYTQVMKENPDVNLELIKALARSTYNASISKLLQDEGVIKTSEEKIEEITTALKPRYIVEKAETLSEVVKDNKDIVDISRINEYTQDVYNKTARQYLIDIGIIKEVDNSETLSIAERLESVIKQLKERYKNKKAVNLSEIINDNKDLSVASVNAWTRKLFNVTAKAYLVEQGIIEKPIEALSMALIFGTDNNEISMSKEKPLEDTVAAVTNKQAEDILKLLKGTYYYDMADSVDQIIRENGHLDIRGLLKWIEETQNDTEDEFLYRKGILRKMPRQSQKSLEENRLHVQGMELGKTDEEMKHVPAIDELIGLIDGINYDGIVNAFEVQKLSEWLSDNTAFLQNSRYGTFLDELREILRDGIIDDEEREFLIRRSYEFKADVDDVEQSLSILAGILDGIICDKEIADEEVFHLYEWISDNEHLQGVPIYDRIEKTLDIILEDNIITEEEREFFLTYTAQIVSASKAIGRAHWSKGNIAFETEALTDLIESVLHDNDGLRSREIAALIPGIEIVDVDRILHAKENRDLFVQSNNYEWHVLSSDFTQIPEPEPVSKSIAVSNDLPVQEVHADIMLLNLSNRSYKALKRTGIDTISQLAELSRDDLCNIRNLGALSVDEILKKLEYYKNGIVEAQNESEESGELERLKTLKKDIPIDVLDLSVRAYNCLVRNRYTLLNHLAGKTRDDLLCIPNMGRGSAGEIIKKVNEFLDANKGLYDENTEISDAPYIREQTKDQLRSVIRNASLSGIKRSDIAGVVDDDLWDRLLKGLVDELINDEEIIEVEPGLYQANFPSILDLIEEVRNGRNRDMVRAWFNGRKLSQIAIAYGISRQRVQQIVSKGLEEALSHSTEVREDKFKYVFTTYEIGKEIWEGCFRESGYIYLYLSARYQRGTKPIDEALEDELVSEEIKTHIRTFIENPDGGLHETESETEDIDEGEEKGILSNVRLMEGTISYVIQYYENLNEKERDLQLYTDREEYESSALRLKKRIARELKRKKYISDVKINDEEYKVLHGFLHYSIPIIQKSKVIPDKDLFITAVVQVAIRAYKDGNFWSNFYEEIQIEQKQQYRTAIGNAFYSVLEERDIIRVSPNEYVQNILLHCFISNNYADAYFDFLYAFYRIDLDRDIDRLDRDLMNELMGSICSDDNEGRTFMLVKHIGQAMAANQRGAKIRIRNHLKLMDRFFWDPEYKITTDHRINNLLQQWVEKSERIKADKEDYSTGKRQGKKRFSSPYIFLDEAKNGFRIVLPGQSIKQVDTYDISWRIIGSSEYKVPVELTESVLGFKVLESEIEIPWNEVLEAYNIDLIIDDTEESIKRFKIKKADVRLFDENGYPINTTGIKVGDVISISRESDIVESNALYESRIVDGIRMSYFQFEFEDIVKFPDGHAVIVGKKVIQNSIAGKGCVEGAICTCDDNQYALYGKVPYLVLRMLPERATGTMIAINGQRHKLTDFDYRQFSLDDRSDDAGFYMNLADVIDDESNDLYRIDVDVPNSIKRSWRFVYIKNFEVQFEDAPYVFEPRGTARFPEHIPILDIEEGCVKESGLNGFKFEIRTVGRTLDFITSAGENSILVNIDIPAFFIQKKNGVWDSEKPAPVWHADLPDNLKLSVPYHKVTLYMEQELGEESDRETREIEYRKNIGTDCIECDITRFKSYLSGDDTIKSLGMRFGDTDTELLEIMIHSKIVSCQLIGDFSEKAFRISAVIQGKAEYYADIRDGDSVIVDKVKLENGKAIIPWDIRNGWYEVDVFEAEEDESGFGDTEYYCIGQYRQKLLDPYDMTGRSFRILQIENRNNTEEIMSFGIQYYVEDLEKAPEKDVYHANMVVEKNSGEIIAYLPVSVYFEDINNPNYVWITFIDEYNEEADFLYDTRRRGILQEENSKISKLACYRRYTMLDYEESIFHIEFCERDERDYDEVDEAIVFQEDSMGIRFRPTSKHRKREKPVSDISWSKAEYFCIRATGDLTLDQLAKRTRREFISVTGASEEITTRIEQIMSFYGYQFSKVSSSSKAMFSKAVALPKTHGIRVEDIRWRNARARACLDRAGIKTLDRIAMMTKQEFSELKAANEAVIERVEQVLEEYGYKFRQE